MPSLVMVSLGQFKNGGGEERTKLTTSSGCELHIASLHAVELFPLFAFGALFEHAIAMRELAA